MKKHISFILTLLIMVSIVVSPIKANAATMNSKVGKVSITSGSLNVRKTASTSSEILKSLKQNSYITLISKSGSWWKVEYAKGKYGYCHTNYIKTASGTPMSVNITSGTLNVRSGAGTSYSKTASLAKGQVVIRLSTKGDWSRILFNGTRLGYVKSDYLTTGNTAVSLNVPSFKQTDSRWANVKIGSSGKTIAQIGCATTAIAMVESYRTNTTIYPNAMAKKLSYTSSGSVYWPSNFVVTTSPSGYLNKIYDFLKQGKPVMIGAKNSYGSQHWVVITGFKGGSLTEANFTINDPGSKTRTSLKQFLDSYPTFYKYFYYK